MRSRLIPAAIVFSMVQLSAAAAPVPGQVEIAAFRGTEGVAGLEVSLDGKVVGTTDTAGKLLITATPGLHLLVLNGPNGRVASTEFRLGDKDAGEIAIALPAQGEGRAEVAVFDTQNLALVDVTGKVSEASGAAAAGATVTAVGLGTTTKTDAQGNFALKLPRGSYTLEVQQGGNSKQFSGVSASPLLASSALALQLDAPAATTAGGATQLNKVVVRAPFRPTTAVAVERQATAVVDTVTKEEISIAGDSDAGEALKRVTGVTVQDDVIIVRGLGDRYSTTLLNGAEIPSPNPSRRVISLDIFPTELLGGLTVQKTYTANLPGDFSGGVALIQSLPIPNVNKGSIELEVGGNSQTTFGRTLTYRGSTGDFFGTDSGIREIPDSVQGLTNNGVTRVDQLSQAERGQVVSALPNIWDLRLVETTAPDVGVSLGYGGNYKGFERAKIGYQLVGFYDNKTRFRREERNDLRSSGAAQSDVDVIDAARQQRSEQTIDTGLAGSVTAEFGKTDRIDFITLLSRNTEKSAFFTEAISNLNFLREDRRTQLDFVESQLLSNQLTGNHKFASLGNFEAKWQVGYSNAERDVLDRRTYSIFRNPGSGDGLFRLAVNAGEGVSPQREYEFLKDDTIDLGLEGKLPVNLTESVKTDFKAGLRSTRRSRDFNTVRYSYTNGLGQDSDAFNAARLAPSLEQILVPQLFGSDGFDIRSALTQGIGGGNSEAYTGDHDIDAFYVAADTEFGEQFSADVGVRIEKSEINVITGDPRQGQTTPALLDGTDVLPAVNLTYKLNRKQQLRAAYSQTVNRPQFRELADVQFLDPETRFISFGNPALEQAEINNYDLRFEQYWAADKAVSVAVFYKDFTNPIEVFIRSDSTGNPQRSFLNSPSAKDYGIEFDGRYRLDALKDYAALFNRLYLAGNFALIESEVDVGNGQTRELQGQSPYIVNLTLGYTVPGKTDVALLFNTFGDRILEVGFLGLPNAIEQSYPLLDFNVRHSFTPSWRGAFKVRNLLDPEIEVLQGDTAQRRYKLGVSAQASLEYQF